MSTERHTYRRRPAPKTRGGCQTCKSRHIRCMQERPTCQNCVKGRRQCFYGPITSPQPYDALRIISWRNPSPGPLPSVSATNWKTAELHFLQRFQTQCCASLKGHFPDVFWDRIIHQVSQNSSAIRNAVVALTLVWDSPQSPNPGPSQEGLSRYNKAVSELQSTLHSRRAVAIEEALLCNVLFVCIEICQQNYETALEQLSSGLDLFCEWNRDCKYKHHSQTGSNEVQTTISTIYRKLLAQATLFIADRSVTLQKFDPSSVIASRPVPHRFRNLCEAKDCLLDLTSAMMHQSLSRHAADNHVAVLANETARPPFRLDISQLQSFSTAYYRSLNPPSEVEVKERVQQITIEVQLLGFEILALVRHQDEPEWAYDEHRKSFARIVALGNEAYALTSHTYEDSKGLTLDMEIVPLLYLTAGRCRDSATRRAALKLLHTFTKQEGLWNGNMLAVVAEYIIHAEETLTTPGQTETARLTLLDAAIMSDTKTLVVTFLVKYWPGGQGTFLQDIISY